MGALRGAMKGFHSITEQRESELILLKMAIGRGLKRASSVFIYPEIIFINLHETLYDINDISI